MRTQLHFFICFRQVDIHEAIQSQYQMGFALRVTHLAGVAGGGGARAPCALRGRFFGPGVRKKRLLPPCSLGQSRHSASSAFDPRCLTEVTATAPFAV